MLCYSRTTAELTWAIAWTWKVWDLWFSHQHDSPVPDAATKALHCKLSNVRETTKRQWLIRKHYVHCKWVIVILGNLKSFAQPTLEFFSLQTKCLLDDAKSHGRSLARTSKRWSCSGYNNRWTSMRLLVKRAWDSFNKGRVGFILASSLWHIFLGFLFESKSNWQSITEHAFVQIARPSAVETSRFPMKAGRSWKTGTNKEHFLD